MTGCSCFFAKCCFAAKVVKQGANQAKTSKNAKIQLAAIDKTARW